jgi:Ulp1 family protease
VAMHSLAYVEHKDIFSQDILLVPVNENGTHWYQVAIFMKECRFQRLDSIRPEEHQPPASVVKYLTAYLEGACKHRRREELNTKCWTSGRDSSCSTSSLVVGISGQDNWWDCGVFACVCMAHLAVGSSPRTVRQSSVSVCRQLIATSIITKKLCWLKNTALGRGGHNTSL